MGYLEGRSTYYNSHLSCGLRDKTAMCGSRDRVDFRNY